MTSDAADPVLVYTKHERANQGDSISGATVGSGVLTGSPYTISNLTNGTEYEVQVQAMNTLTEFGEWSMSQFVTPVVSALPAIDAPSLPTLSSTTSTSVSFAWTAVTGAEKYGVQLRTGTGAWDGPHEVLTGTSYTAAALSPDTRYEFQVAAYGDGTTRRAAWGDWSPSLEADTAVDPTPQTCVTDLGSIDGTTSVTGEWTADCDSTHRPGKYAKFFTFEIPAAAEVTIELVGSEDPFLFLLEGSGTSGRILKKNDDSQDSTLGWTNSRIVRTQLAGTYTAEATTFNNNRTGTFTISINAELLEPNEPTNVQAAAGDGEIVVTWVEPDQQWGVGDHRLPGLVRDRLRRFGADGDRPQRQLAVGRVGFCNQREIEDDHWSRQRHHLLRRGAGPKRHRPRRRRRSLVRAHHRSARSTSKQCSAEVPSPVLRHQR